MDDQTVVNIAKNHGKTPSQVLLRFLTQLDITVIPKSSNTERMKQNVEVWFFMIYNTTYIDFT